VKRSGSGRQNDDFALHGQVAVAAFDLNGDRPLQSKIHEAQGPAIKLKIAPYLVLIRLALLFGRISQRLKSCRGCEGRRAIA
jgi:hypothetical protein